MISSVQAVPLKTTGRNAKTPLTFSRAACVSWLWTTRTWTWSWCSKRTWEPSATCRSTCVESSTGQFPINCSLTFVEKLFVALLVSMYFKPPLTFCRRLIAFAFKCWINIGQNSVDTCLQKWMSTELCVSRYETLKLHWVCVSSSVESTRGSV